ncbi:TPA: hypothetical protein ACH3X1_002404 [Trebouxia sp. C0004]
MRCAGGKAAPGPATDAVGGHWRAFTAFRARLPVTMTRATCKMHRVICLASPGPGLVGAFAAQGESPGYRKRLEYVASLTAFETGVSLTISVLSCTAYYLVKAPNHLSFRFALSVALLFAASLTVCKTLLLERKHQDRLMAEQELKDHDSVFRELHGTAVHYKLAQGLDTAHPTAVHCYHGFGANTFSWSYVYKALSTQLRAQVTKHDMPGFGLTQRPRDIDGYSLEFNGLLGRLVMDAELAAAGVLSSAALDSEVGPGLQLEQVQSVSREHQSKTGGAEKSAASPSDIQAAASQSKPDLQHANYQARGDSQSDTQAAVGSSGRQHSPSHRSDPSASVHDSSAPESPISSRSSWESVSSVDSNRVLSREQLSRSSHGADTKKQQPSIKRVLIGHSLGAACAAAEVIKHSRDIAGLVLVAPAIISFSSQLKAQPASDQQQNNTPMHGRILQVLMAFAQVVGTRTAGIVLWLLQPILVLFLRTLVRSRLFWVRGLSNAWHSRDGVSDELVDAYRLPQLVRGWELGLVRFVRARVADSRSFVQVLKDAYNGRTPMSQAEQLAHAVAQQDIKV